MVIHVVMDSVDGSPHSDYAVVSFQRGRGTVKIPGMECLNTKEPSKQSRFLLLEEHIHTGKLWCKTCRYNSKII